MAVFDGDALAAIRSGDLQVRYEPTPTADACVNALAFWVRESRIVEHGLDGALASFVLHRACRDALRWSDPASRTVCIHISASCIERRAFVTVVRQALLESGLPPTRLRLSIDESSGHEAAHPGHVRDRVIDELRAIGVDVSVETVGAISPASLPEFATTRH